jgi:hypothetical protein
MSGCAGLGRPPQEPFASKVLQENAIGQCARAFEKVDRIVSRWGVSDAETVPVPGFPFLRTNRFLASGIKPSENSPALGTWGARLRMLDMTARRKELANLPPKGIKQLKTTRPPRPDPAAQLNDCGQILLYQTLARPSERHQLLDAAHVPPSYSLTKRVLGLYPLTSLFVLEGVNRLHADIQQDFLTPLQALEIQGTLIQFAPDDSLEIASSAEVADILRHVSRNPLHIPTPEGMDRDRLFATFAPVWEVDVSTNADRIGMPFWGNAPYPGVDVNQPIVFRRVSHTQFQGHTLLQLNYITWFPARPRTGAFDLLGGHMDGITWRVTLTPNGHPLLFDTMHNCGCYHMFLPGPLLRLKSRTWGHEEPPLVPQRMPTEAGRTTLRIASRTHYLQRVYHRPQDILAVPYEMQDYDELRSLPLPQGGHRSLFNSDGLVPGTERRECWFLWPMGVASAGAMRQWGHHATAFVGQRHFDDPYLIERYFEKNPDVDPHFAHTDASATHHRAGTAD